VLGLSIVMGSVTITEVIFNPNADGLFLDQLVALYFDCNGGFKDFRQSVSIIASQTTHNILVFSPICLQNHFTSETEGCKNRYYALLYHFLTSSILMPTLNS